MTPDDVKDYISSNRVIPICRASSHFAGLQKIHCRTETGSDSKEYEAEGIARNSHLSGAYYVRQAIVSNDDFQNIEKIKRQRHKDILCP